MTRRDDFLRALFPRLGLRWRNERWAFTFDLEGTLIDLEIFHFFAFEAALAAIGVKMTAMDIAALPGAIGGGDDFIAKALTGGDIPLAQNVLKRKHKLFDTSLSDHAIAARLGAEEFIEALLVHGVPVRMGTLTEPERVKLLLTRSGLIKFFPLGCVATRGDVRNVKPDPEVYFKTARMAGVDPKQQIVFEDSVAGVRAARAARSIPIAVPSPLFRKEDHYRNLRNAGARNVCDEWSDVYRPSRTSLKAVNE